MATNHPHLDFDDVNIERNSSWSAGIQIVGQDILADWSALEGYYYYTNTPTRPSQLNFFTDHIDRSIQNTQASLLWRPETQALQPGSGRCSLLGKKTSMQEET